jgi:ABC-type glutathione transport system ATPase component
MSETTEHTGSNETAFHRQPSTVRHPLLSVRNLSTFYPVTGGFWKKTVSEVRAVDGVSLEIRAGEIVALVGESGCGKSTLGFSLLGLTLPTSGELDLLGNRIDIRDASSWKPYRRDFQIVFQDPYTALNPRLTVFELLAEPLRTHRVVPASGLKAAVVELLRQVGLPEDSLPRFPHAFSGGQRQRLCIARALGVRPKLLVCDEVVSALDVSVQAQIIHLLLDLRREHGLALLFITHDLSLVRSIADRVLVMNAGKVVEEGPTAELFTHPRDEYTQTLIAAVPTLKKRERKPLQILSFQILQEILRVQFFAGRAAR